MGQYHVVVNLDKQEFVYPYQIGCGLKLWEQLANSPSTGTALIVLLASASNGQGGGDLEESPVVGRWRGDRIAFVGDYDEESVYVVGAPVTATPLHTMTGAEIYGRCRADKDEGGEGEPWTNVTPDVCAVIERELGGKFEGDGWCTFKYDGEDESASRAMKPDMVIIAR